MIDFAIKPKFDKIDPLGLDKLTNPNQFLKNSRDFAAKLLKITRIYSKNKKILKTCETALKNVHKSLLWRPPPK